MRTIIVSNNSAFFYFEYQFGLHLDHLHIGPSHQALCIGHANALDAQRADHAAALHALHIKQAYVSEATQNAHADAMQVRIGKR